VRDEAKRSEARRRASERSEPTRRGVLLDRLWSASERPDGILLEIIFIDA